MLLSLTVAFGTSFFSVQSNNHQALAQGISTPKILAPGTANTIRTSNEVAQLATNHNRSVVNTSNTTTLLSSYVVQFGSNQNRNHRTLDYATVSGDDPIAQFGSNRLR